MKYLFITFLIVILLITPTFAAAEGDSENPSEVITVTAPDVYLTVKGEDPSVTVIDVNDDTSVRSQFASAIVSIFGEYTPRTQTVTTYLADGSQVVSVEVVPGLAGLDWLWLSSVGLFALFLFCLMRLLGGAVK